ncbi:hypothetical protein [Streptomyces sp. NPDC020141]|uniref:hypothetical protein n=1 Tax=Streptomyces sp. NPDC020141 TaxID=3365065 RepID=UPI00378C10BA
MSSTRDGVSPSLPRMWFRLPPGYCALDGISLDMLEETTTSLLAPILENAPAVQATLRDAQTLVALLQEMREHGNVYTALGAHPDEVLGTSMSLFSLSMAETSSPSRTLTVARSALAVADSPLWGDCTRRLVELPIGPAALVTGSLALPSREALVAMGIASEPTEIFQARLVVACPAGTHCAVADLTSAAVHHAESYTDILEGIARTMSFTEPTAEAPVRRHSRIQDLIT